MVYQSSLCMCGHYLQIGETTTTEQRHLNPTSITIIVEMDVKIELTVTLQMTIHTHTKHIFI